MGNSNRNAPPTGKGGTGRDSLPGQGKPALAQTNTERTVLKANAEWLAALRKHMGPGRLLQVYWQHDHDCSIFTEARLCDCDPTRILKDKRGRTLARVDGAGFFDPFEVIGAAQ